MENNLYYISGYWKDNRSTFENYLVSEAEDTESDDDNVFFYGLSMEEAMAYMFEEDAPFEFVITSVQPFTQHHSCLTWSKEDFNGDEKLMNRFFTECNEIIIQSINEMKAHWMAEQGIRLTDEG